MLETRGEGASWLVDGAPSLSGQSNPAKWMKRAQRSNEASWVLAFPNPTTTDCQLYSTSFTERVYSFRTFLP
jgi:hypothetical protein